MALWAIQNSAEYKVLGSSCHWIINFFFKLRNSMCKDSNSFYNNLVLCCIVIHNAPTTTAIVVEIKHMS